MNQLTTFRNSPPKKMKVEPQMMKQETNLTSSEAQNCMTSLTSMMTGGAGSWFPAISTGYGAGTGSGTGHVGQYQAVYPGMVPQYHATDLQQVMKIGECSIKPLGQ